MKKTKNIVEDCTYNLEKPCQFFKFDYKIFSEIETVASKNAYFLGGFSDARIFVELNFF